MGKRSREIWRKIAEDQKKISGDHLSALREDCRFEQERKDREFIRAADIYIREIFRRAYEVRKIREEMGAH